MFENSQARKLRVFLQYALRCEHYKNILENILLFFLYPDRWRAYGWNAGCAPMVAVVAERREELTWPDWGGYPREHAAGH
jgi:hypothetical protein